MGHGNESDAPWNRFSFRSFGPSYATFADARRLGQSKSSFAVCRLRAACLLLAIYYSRFTIYYSPSSPPLALLLAPAIFHAASEHVIYSSTSNEPKGDQNN
jgi:hypothetical protein